MSCKSCNSEKQKLFPSEICIHFPGGLEALHKGTVMAFPQLLVCLKCGFTECLLPEAELHRLVQDAHGGSSDDRQER
jgi:hypothetical protein